MNRAQVYAELVSARERHKEARAAYLAARHEESKARFLMQKWQVEHVKTFFDAEPLIRRIPRLPDGRPSNKDKAHREQARKEHKVLIFRAAARIGKETGLPLYSNDKPCVADILADKLHYSKVKIRNCITEGRKLAV